MGSIQDLLAMIPGIGNKAKDIEVDEKKFDRMKAIIYSMTEKERTNPDIINPSRKKRIAAGSGQSIEEVNRLLAQFRQMQKMFKQMGGKKGGKRRRKQKFKLPQGFDPSQFGM
jgi:signal recognition particle subunit SRP54